MFNFDIGDMKVGQQEIVTISCKGQDDSINSVMYIILIQSKDELIIETYKNDFLVADNSFQIVRWRNEDNLIKIKPKYTEAQHMKPPFNDDFAC